MVVQFLITVGLQAVFGVGKYHLYAEIWEEAGAYTVFDIDTAFRTVMPTQEQYESYDLTGDLKAFTDVGDSSRIAMILQVDAGPYLKIEFNRRCTGGRQCSAEGELVQPGGPDGGQDPGRNGTGGGSKL